MMKEEEKNNEGMQQKWNYSLRRIATDMGIPVQHVMKYTEYELEDLIRKSIAIRLIKGKNLLKRMQQLERRIEDLRPRQTNFLLWAEQTETERRIDAEWQKIKEVD